MNSVKQIGLKIIYLAFLFSLLFFFSCSESDNPTSPAGPNNSDIKILVLKDGGTEDSVYSILKKAGYSVTVGQMYYDFDGKFINDYHLIILLNGVDYGQYMSDSVEIRLKNYVRDGGTLLTTEWMTYSIYNTSNIYTTLREILPSLYDGDYAYENETYRKMLTHPITNGLPDTLSISNGNWSYSKTTIYSSSLLTDIKVLFRGDGSGAALTIGQLNKGYVIHWNMAGQYRGAEIWTDNVKKILTNIAGYSGTN